MSLSNTYETTTLKWLLTTDSVTRPTAWYVALFTAVADGETGSVTEVSTGGYARQSATFSVTGNTASNSAAVEYPTATASYGTVTHAGIYDASTGGNLIGYTSLSASKAIDTGDVLRIPTGDLDVTFS